MRVLVTGATGYIGNAVAQRLFREGCSVSGVTRSPEGARQLEVQGIRPVIAQLTDKDILAAELQNADTLINTATSDDQAFVQLILEQLAGSGKTFLHTSGSSVVADHRIGEAGDQVFEENTPFYPQPSRRPRLLLEQQIQTAARNHMRTLIIRPSMVYGDGASVQVPMLIDYARKKGLPGYIGKGENIWSHVHRDDLVELYLRILQAGVPGELYHAASGEASFKAMAEAISHMLGTAGKTESMTLEAATAYWGAGPARFLIGSNSRVSSDKARKLLGWKPTQPDVLKEIQFGSYSKN